MRIKTLLLHITLLAAASNGLCADERKKPGVIEQNTKVIQRYFEEVWNQGKVDVLDELLTSDYRNHSASIANPRPGPQDLKPIVRAMRKGIPDLHYEILDIVMTDAKAAVYLRVTGTHTGDFFGLPPTGKKIDVRQMQIEWLNNGRISQHWRVTEDFGLSQPRPRP